MMTIQATIDGDTRSFERGTDVQAIVDTFFPGRKPQPIAANVNGRIRPLDWTPDADCTLAVLDYTDDEARRIYERSLRFLFLMAAQAVLADARVRIEHSVGYGLYIDVDAPLTEQIVAEIERKMCELRDAALPFVRERWSRERAISYFAGRGEDDKVRLLTYRPHEFFDVYRCGGMVEYFYGIMLPSTGHIHTFALRYHAPGVVLQMPSPQQPDEVAPFARRPKMMAAFAQSARWHDILDCQNVSDLNDMITQGKIRDFVRVNEALQEKSIASIADEISSRRDVRTVFISGPSSSGKTTFTNRLAVQLRVNGLRPVMLSLDNYYRDVAQIPLGEDGQPDLECLEALDLPLLGEHLRALSNGEEVLVPRYSFRQEQRKAVGEPLRVREGQLLLIEGIHGLNPRLTASVPPQTVYKVYVSALATLNLDDHNRIRTTDLRLLRRMVRDNLFRSTPFEGTLSMWASVRRGEEQYIFPYQEQADVMFNSALAYEISVLRAYAYPMLRAIGEESPYFTMARRLVKFLAYFVEADVEAEIPPTSILREFIGGNAFYME